MMANYISPLKATKEISSNSKGILPRRMLMSLSFLAIIALCPIIGFSQSSTNTTHPKTVYKFSVTDVTELVQADDVRTLLLSYENIASCKFFDEGDCFKLTATELLTYEMLENMLMTDGFALSPKVYLSDETILHSKSN